MSNNWYLYNPLIHRDRQLSKHSSQWVAGFSCEDMKPLIICRGPIRKEAMEVFDEMGIDGYGILLSEKDSITYSNALAPELRMHTDPNRVHRVPDYTGASKEERLQRIQQIIAIAHENGYNSIFAGYGFMAEDEEMVRSMEEAGLNFIGPCSGTQRAAGLKDEAKRTALKVGVSVTPGVDNASALTLLQKYPDEAALKKLLKTHKLKVAADTWKNDELSLEDKADVRAVEQPADTCRTRTPGDGARLRVYAGGGGRGWVGGGWIGR